VNAVCLCDGRYAGCDHELPCHNEPGTPWGPHFCAECDPRRLDHISRNLEEMQRSFTRQPEE